ncbi:MAG: helix-turn-helix domain-containing protein [Caldilineaceae bacterium]|nr:helix-turn-helix domain-containing protein [Caldilineaceae bacterium]
MHTGSALLMLLAIADHANDDGVCWPSISTLAEKARVKPRQAQNLITQLRESGELSVRTGKGRNNTSIYVVTIGEKGAIQRVIDRAEKVQSSAQNTQSSAENMQSSVIKHAIAIAYDPSEPSIEPSLEPSERAAALPPAPPVTPPAPAPTSKTPPAVQSVAFALDGEPLPASRPQTAFSLVKLPAVVAYRDIFLAYPPKSQMVQIQAHGVEDMERWRTVLGAWCRCGYSPRNIGGMLDWYDDPARMATPGAKGAKPGATRAPAQSKVAASLQAVDDVFAMLDRAGGMD